MGGAIDMNLAPNVFRSQRSSLEGAFTIFRHLNLFSETFHLKVNTFFTFGQAYY